MGVRERKERERAAARQAALEVAVRLLEAGGPQAVTVRAIAQELEYSTTVVYTLFGGMQGVWDALYLEGMRRLGEGVAAVPRSGDAPHDLRAVCRAYRRAAADSAAFYPLLFARPVPGYRPSDEAIAGGQGGLAPLVRVLAAGIQDGSFVSADLALTAETVWAALHGAVSLELDRRVLGPEHAEARFERLLELLLRGLRAETTAS
ncbi:AcrR family transcriptional regulator [Deinobacterium chartae]|uniref:AcrR family transcriptional regulator n=1 Tax=Deinobacterium chartae TaxID=521158 RepID=A0A841HYS1_9DEIO|nr:AcrR family transcriptional regulator [Deinobacterium chartae]